MYINKTKLFVIFIIIIAILFNVIVLNNIQSENPKYSTRRTEYNKFYENDYSAQNEAKIYLENFIEESNIDPDKALVKYVDESFYNEKIKNNKEQYIINFKKSISIIDTVNNYYDILESSSITDENDIKTFRFKVIILQKGLSYPEGYNILKNIDDPDKSKNIDIEIKEELPYTFKIVMIKSAIEEGDL